MFVCLPQEEAWTSYIDPPHGVRKYIPVAYRPVESFFVESNLNIEPWFDGRGKSRVLQWITPHENLQEGEQERKVFANIHYHKLHEQRLREIEIALKLDAEKEVPFYAGTVTNTSLQKQDSRGTIMTETSSSNFYLYLPSNASTNTFPNNGPTGFTVTLPNTLELYGEWEVALARYCLPSFVGQHCCTR